MGLPLAVMVNAAALAPWSYVALLGCCVIEGVVSPLLEVYITVTEEIRDCAPIVISKSPEEVIVTVELLTVADTPVE